MKKVLALIFIASVIGLSLLLNTQITPSLEIPKNMGGLTEDFTPNNPLMITQMRAAQYPGSNIEIEQTLSPGLNYNRYIASYKSEGLKIYGLLTIPIGKTPENGWPAIIFNHGYIPPEEYKTTEKYVAYVDGFAKNNYVVFKPDYRGHGNSEGQPEGAYYSPAYTIDVLNALSSVKKYPDVNPDKIGMWGHSMGGHITLRAMVINKDIKAGVIWSGVVASYEDMMNNWHRNTPWNPSPKEQEARGLTRQNLLKEYGEPNSDSDFWNSISPINFVTDISGPIQIHHGTEDETVPWEFSESLDEALSNVNKEHEFYLYEGADHNLSGNAFNLAMSRSVTFFDKYLK